MIKSFRLPATLPTIVGNYFEPTNHNGFELVGGNRATHQLFISHQVRLLNTILGDIRGLKHKRPLEMAKQNMWLNPADITHLLAISDRSHHSGLINETTKRDLDHRISELFEVLFPAHTH